LARACDGDDGSRDGLHDRRLQRAGRRSGAADRGPGERPGRRHDSVVINGQFTTFQAGFSTVSFGSGITVNFITGVTLTQLTANITIDPNATVGNRDVSVTTNGTMLTLGQRLCRHCRHAGH
jgi:hypothetical protein